MANNQSNGQQNTQVKKGDKKNKRETPQVQKPAAERTKIGGLVLATKLGMFGF